MSLPTEPLTSKDLEFDTVRDGWIHSADGDRVSYVNPQPQQFTIDSIATGLAHTCRYSGQIPEFYSVAEHSMNVAEAVLLFGAHKEFPDDNIALLALLHDASEAFMCDIPSPLKVLLPDYRFIEGRMSSAIFRRFALSPSQMAIDFVHEMDRRVLAAEIQDLQPRYPSDFVMPYERVPFTIRPLGSFEVVRDNFIRSFNLLYYQGDRYARKSRY